jgi:hypothetical protein
VRKSSANPTEIKLLDGIHALFIEMGNAHTMVVARDETEQDKANLAELPVYEL